MVKGHNDDFRRTWDKATYERLALDRLKKEREDKKGEFLMLSRSGLIFTDSVNSETHKSEEKKELLKKRDYKVRVYYV